MGVYIEDNKLVIITEPKAVCFNLTKKIDNNLKHEIGHIIKSNEFLAEPRIKNEIERILSIYNHGNDIHEHRKQ